jgi:hypothetical protein
MTKDELLDALEDEREKFLESIEGLSEEAMQEPGVMDDRSVKDLIYHLTMWEAELVQLLWQAQQGQQPTTVHFSGKTVDEINAAWATTSKERSLEHVMEDFFGVRSQTTRRLRSFSEQDLNDPKRFTWLQDHPLWSWVESDSYKHEAEHAAQITAWRAKRDI